MHALLARPRVRSLVHLVGAAVLFGSLAAGCGGGAKRARPVSSLTPDLVAKRSFQDALRAWERSDVTTRADAREVLEQHLRDHPRDPTARATRAMLALLALDAGDLAEAWELAEAARGAGIGVVRDDADVVRGAVLLRRDDPTGAIAILRPLDGKIIDPHFRDAFDGELADAAVRTGDAPRALEAMRRWLARTPSVERAAVRERIVALIALMEEATLRAALAAPLPDDDGDLVIGQVAARLATLARQRRDALLARYLLDRVPDRLGDDADPLAAIAARASGATVAPRTIGLLLSTRSTELARRGLEVAAGMSYALRRAEPPSADAPGEPSSSAVAGAPTLLVRDGQVELEGLADVVARLAADGAGLVVGGFDQAEADAIAAYATSSRLPVVLLVPPSRPPSPTSRIYVIGEPAPRVRAVLLAALGGAGRRRVAVLSSEPDGVAPDEASGGSAVVAVQPCGAPLDFARTAAADALLVDGGPDCARGALEGLAKLREPLPAAYSLDAGTEPDVTGWRATAGLLPAAGGEPALAPWTERGRGAPTWWAALGHDAGALAVAALERAGGGAASEVQAVEARRAAIASALEGVEARLWSSEARGFARERSLRRDVRAVATPPASGRPPVSGRAR